VDAKHIIYQKQNNPKTNQKQTKNKPKTNQKQTKNKPKTNQKQKKYFFYERN
jgi:hypothetical protein